MFYKRTIDPEPPWVLDWLCIINHEKVKEILWKLWIVSEKRIARLLIVAVSVDSCGLNKKVIFFVPFAAISFFAALYLI